MARHTNLLLLCGAAAVTAAGAYLVHRYYLRDHFRNYCLCASKSGEERDDVAGDDVTAISARDLILQLGEACATPKELLARIVEDMCAEMVAGLKCAQGSTLKMLPSYVDKLPDGSETGVFYALDLGGTNFRVLRVPLHGRNGGIGKMESVSASIGQELMTGTTEALFDHLAATLKSFVDSEDESMRPKEGQRRELGFTFSFPCEQTAINAGKLIRWTKGFDIRETEGRDVVQVLEEAMARQNVEMKVTALVNDAVGTLAGARFVEPDVMLAVILGTGTNACYEETKDTSCRMAGTPTESGRMVINTEWGNFFSTHLPITPYDDRLDSKSPNCGEQRYEKLTSGMYIGEIARLALADISRKSNLFGPTPPAKLEEAFSLLTPNVAIIHSDTTADLAETDKVLQEVFQLPSTTVEQRQLVKEVCSIVGNRGARLVAAGIVGLLQKLGRDGKSAAAGGADAGEEDGAALAHVPHTVIAVDGGLYEHYTPFREIVHETLKELLGDDVAGFVSMHLSKDGSGIGAALLAASHSAYK